jgi:hypothetical protein
VKRWQYIVLLGVGALGIVYVYLHRQELGLAGPPKSPNTETANPSLASSFSRPAQITWATVNRPKDGFSVEMPVDVKEIQIPAYNESGGTDQVNMVFSNPDAETTFSVSWADDPPVVRANARSPERVLNMARDEALARTQTSLVRETKSTRGGFEARDILAQNAGGGVFDTRLIYTGERLYMLTAAFPSMNARREQDVIRFFNSFKASATGKNP